LASITHTCQLPLRSLVKTILLPSGEKAGKVLLPTLVSCCGVPPSLPTT